MTIWSSLAGECWLWLKEAVVFRAVLGLIDAGMWLRDHGLLPDLWYRYWSTRTVMWLADFIARRRP